MKEEDKEKKQKPKKINWVKKLFSILEINRNTTLTAREANIISRYGTRITSFDHIVDCEIKKIRESIYNTLEYSSEKMLSIQVPSDKAELFEKVKEHFSNAGYKTFYIDKTNVKELGENKYLFISWDLSEEELNKNNY